jgi:hypothetical protein
LHSRPPQLTIGGDALWGGLMRWFDKEKPKEVWEEAVPSPLGDIEAAERIRNICRSVADSAAVVASRAEGGKHPAKKFEIESERYQRAAKAAMELAMKVSDELMRDAAVREIVELCLKANDLKTAKILFRAIQSPAIRDPVLRDFPALRP